MTNSLDLENQVAVVTGASSGIGNAIALGLAKKKVNLCLVGRNVDRLKKQKEILIQNSPKVTICKADLSNESDIKKISTAVLKEFGTVSILIHSAGFLSMGAVENAKFDNLILHFKVNFYAPYLITQSLLPALKETQGQIIFINSSAIQRAIPNLAQYSSSKFALKGLADTLREEINPFGVRVLSIFPGQTATSMQNKLYNEKCKTYEPDRLLQPRDISDIIIYSLTLPRTAEVSEIFIRPMMKSL